MTGEIAAAAVAFYGIPVYVTHGFFNDATDGYAPEPHAWTRTIEFFRANLL